MSMTSSETLKAARLLRTIAKPLWSAGESVARNLGEFARDIRPGRATPKLDRFATNMGQRVLDADAHTAGMGRAGRAGVGVGRFLTSTVPAMAAITALPASATPVWTSLQHIGNSAGQALRWGLNPEGTQEQVRQGGRDAMVNLYSTMQNMPYADRSQVIAATGRGEGVGFENGAYAQTHGNPWGFQQAAQQIGLRGEGDMRGFLTRRALQIREQQRANQGYTKASYRTKHARALLRLVTGGARGAERAAVREGVEAAAHGAPHGLPHATPASQMTINVPSQVLPPTLPPGVRPPPLPGGAPNTALSIPARSAAPTANYGQVANKWLRRGAGSLIRNSKLPLGLGAVAGFAGANDVARDVGADIATNEFQNKIQEQGWLGQTALGFDPSLMLTPELYQAFPDFQKTYEAQTFLDDKGNALHPKLDYGPIAGIRNAWNNPSFLASDSVGSYNVPAPLPFNH